MQSHLDSYYEETNAANYWVMGNNVKDVENEIKNIEKIKEVTQVEKRLKIKAVDNSKNGGILEISFVSDNKISKNLNIKGKEFNPKENGLWLDKEYAKKHGYKVGDEINIKYMGKESKERIEGFIQNPEYVYYLSGTDQLIPDYDENGYGFMSYEKNIGEDKVLYNEILIKTKKI